MKLWRDVGEAMTEALDWQRGTDPVWNELSPGRIFNYVPKPKPGAWLEITVMDTPVRWPDPA